MNWEVLRLILKILAAILLLLSVSMSVMMMDAVAKEIARKR